MAETDLILAAKSTALEPAMADGEIGPLTLNPDGRLRVASKPAYFQPIFGVLTAAGNTLVADVTDASNIVLHIKNIGSAAMAAGAFVFEGSVDSTDGSDGTWFSVQGARSDSNTIETGRATSSLAAGAAQAYAWELSVNAIRWFRIRCSTSLTTNAQAQWTIIRGTYATEPIPAVQPHGITGTVSVTPPTGSAYVAVTTAAVLAAVMKATAGSVFEISASNPTGTPAYLKLYNKATAPATADVPVVTFVVPPNSQVTFEFGAIGKRFLTGIGVGVTGAMPAADTTATVAGIQLSATYI